MKFPESEPGSTAILSALASRLTFKDMDTISRADYGQDAADHAVALERIRRTGTVPIPLDWVPREVLNLTRWSDAEASGVGGLEGAHLRRAFSAAAILHADTEDGLGWGATNATMAVLTESAHELGADIEVSAAELAAWVIHRERDPEELPFLGLAFLSLALAAPRRWTDLTILDVSEWIMSREDEVAAPWRSSPGLGHEGSWLLDSETSMMRRGLWRKIVGDLRHRAISADRNPEVIEVMGLFGAMMAD